jgi:hypothetical protein
MLKVTSKENKNVVDHIQIVSPSHKLLTFNCKCEGGGGGGGGRGRNPWTLYSIVLCTYSVKDDGETSQCIFTYNVYVIHIKHCTCTRLSQSINNRDEHFVIFLTNVNK